MYRFLLTPRWIAFHVLVIVGIVVMIGLGFWQLRRLDERKEFNSEVTSRTEMAPLPLTELLAEPTFDPQTAEWRPVVVNGTWLPDQIILFNRAQNGRAGDNVLTPLALDDGTIVVINRGFLPVEAVVPDPLPADITVLGTVRQSQVRQRGGLTDSGAEGEAPLTEIRRVDIDRLADQLPGPVAPVYLDLITSDPAVNAGDPLPVPLPELDQGPHLSYAVQWFIFAICVGIGWVLAIRRSISRRRRAPTTP